MGAADDLTRSRAFLEKWMASVAVQTAEADDFPPTRPLEPDTADGDIHEAIGRLSERSHQMQKNQDRMMGMLTLAQQGIQTLLLQQTADESTDNQTDRRLERIDAEGKETREAVSTLQRWRAGVRASTAAWATTAGAIGAVLSYAVEHLHLGK